MSEIMLQDFIWADNVWRTIGLVSMLPPFVAMFTQDTPEHAEITGGLLAGSAFLQILFRLDYHSFEFLDIQYTLIPIFYALTQMAFGVLVILNKQEIIDTGSIAKVIPKAKLFKTVFVFNLLYTMLFGTFEFMADSLVDIAEAIFGAEITGAIEASYTFTYASMFSAICGLVIL